MKIKFVEIHIKGASINGYPGGKCECGVYSIPKEFT
jgi:hypothetical protein